MSIWTEIEKTPSVAFSVTPESVIELAASPQRHMSPTFNENGRPDGIGISAPLTADDTHAPLYSVIVVAPGSHAKVLDRLDFDGKYRFKP